MTSPEQSTSNILKTCSHCAADLPLDAFGLRSTGRYGRREFCRECGRLAERRLRAKRKHGHLVKFCDEVSRTANQERVVALTIAILRRYNGIAGFTHEFAEHLKQHPREWRKAMIAVMNLAQTSKAILRSREWDSQRSA